MCLYIYIFMSFSNLTALYLLMHRPGLGYWYSVAHRALGALMGPRVIKHETVASSASDVPPAPNTNGVGSSTVCADQFKALIDV